MANNDEKIVEVDGEVIDAKPNAQFEVKLDNGETVLAYLSGKMREHYINILPGDRVKLELSVHDLTRGRIVYRYSD